MKKSFLALALMSAFSGAAFAQSSVTIYGIVDMGVVRDDNGSGAKTSLDSGVQNSSRLGFKGVEDLGSGLKANFVLEMGLKADTGASDQGGLAFGRQAYVGLSGDFGSVNLGRQKSVTYDIGDNVDPFHINLAGNMDRLFKTSTRTDNAITYSTNSLSGFVGSLQYGFGEVAGNNSGNRKVGVSGVYAAGPVYAAIAYEKLNDAAGNDANAGKKTFVGGTYDFTVVKAHAAYETIKGGTNDERIWMIGATVPFGPGAFVADFIQAKNKAVANADGKQFAIGYTYDLSKRTDIYTSFSRTTNDNNGKYNVAAAGQTDKLLNVGIRHKF